MTFGILGSFTSSAETTASCQRETEPTPCSKEVGKLGVEDEEATPKQVMKTQVYKEDLIDDLFLLNRAQSVMYEPSRKSLNLDIGPKKEVLLKQFSIIESLSRFDDSMYQKSKQLSQRIDEAHLKEAILSKTTTFVDRSLEVSATVYLKTQDAVSNFKVAVDYERIKESTN